MWWIPRLHRLTLIDPDTIMMSDDRRTTRSCRPITTRCIRSWARCCSIWYASCEDIMIIEIIPSAENSISFLIEWIHFRESIHSMKCFETISYEHSLRIVPWTLPDTVSSIHSYYTTWCRSTEVGSPCTIPCTHWICKTLTIRISTSESTEISSTARIHACDEEAHFCTWLYSSTWCLSLYWWRNIRLTRSRTTSSKREE